MTTDLSMLEALRKMYYFAYGSNLNKRQMKERCPEAKPLFTATLHHYKLVFLGWSRKWRGGVASIMPFRGEKVVGGIYEVSEACLKRLDNFEGPSYRRQNIKVNTELGDLVETVTYVKIRELEEGKPSPEYLSLIQQGYRDWGLI